MWSSWLPVTFCRMKDGRVSVIAPSTKKQGGKEWTISLSPSLFFPVLLLPLMWKNGVFTSFSYSVCFCSLISLHSSFTKKIVTYLSMRSLALHTSLPVGGTYAERENGRQVFIWESESHYPSLCDLILEILDIPLLYREWTPPPVVPSPLYQAAGKHGNIACFYGSLLPTPLQVMSATISFDSQLIYIWLGWSQ